MATRKTSKVEESGSKDKDEGEEGQGKSYVDVKTESDDVPHGADQPDEPRPDEDEATETSGDSRDLFPEAQRRIHVDDVTVVYLPDGAPRIGQFATVTGGDHEGRYGVVENVATFDKNGWPETVLFRTRDEDSSLLTVDYSDLKETVAGRR